MSEQVREAAAAREQAERTLRDMKEFIEEAKVVDKRNCRLDAQMSTEIARRKKLHDYVEDLKGKIRVYVRVRPLSSSEASKGLGMACSPESRHKIVVKTTDETSANHTNGHGKHFPSAVIAGSNRHSAGWGQCP